MKIELDLSPSLINATAMAHLCRDAAEALTGLEVRGAYFGEVRDRPPEGADAARLRGRLDALLASGGANPGLLATDVDRRVFLDPLYTLFGEVREQDAVLILDLSVVTTPRWHNPAVAKLYEKAMARIAAVQPRLLAISQNTADSYYANYGYPRRDIAVTPLYVPDHLLDPPAAAGLGREGRPYFLFVGSLEARKNVAGAIRSFGLSGMAERGFDFILAGGAGHGAEAAHAAAAQTRNVHLTGRVSHDELAALYAGASGFIYPSYLEGFGIPLLEALGYGVPAVSSITGACPEVGGDLVAYCDPDDHAALAAEIARIGEMTADQRAAFAVAARDRATQVFSKARFQAAFRQAVEDI